jgi:hypothetical protein
VSLSFLPNLATIWLALSLFKAIYLSPNWVLFFANTGIKGGLCQWGFFLK